MTNKRLAKELKKFIEGIKPEENLYKKLAWFMQQHINKTNNAAYARGKFEGLSQ